MKRSEVIEQLKSARAKIIDPLNWTKGVAARDTYGRPIGSCHVQATSWCALGAVMVTAKHSNPIIDLLEEELPGNQSLTHFNDSNSHADVISLFNKTIEKLETSNEAV